MGKVLTKSQAAREARQGKDLGKPGKGFQAIVAKTEGKYGEAAAKRIAGSVFQRQRKAGKL